MNLDRRSLLAATLLTGAALGFCDTARAAEPAARTESEGLSARLARHVSETRYEDLPPQAVEMAKRSILDAIGVSLASSGLEPACQPFVELAVEAGGPQSATILGMGKRASPAMAALANGAFAHAMDYEDSHEATRTHPNAAAVAAGLALAESLGNVSGRRLITAVALGCDMVCRLAAAQPEIGAVTARTTGFYRPAVLGTMGAVTAAAKLLELNPTQILDAFSLAICNNSVSGEILFSPDSHMRAVRDGFCAQSGVNAALLARKGVKGFDQPFEGEAGFFVMYGDGKYKPEILLADLGKTFAGADIAFKAWPSCRDTHLYIQAALEMMKEKPVALADIAAIETVVAQRNLIVCEPAASKKAPRTAIDAKFSIYFTLATALTRKAVTFDSFTEKARADAAVLALASKVSYRIDEKIAAPVDAGGGVVLTVRMKNGTARQQKVQHLYGSTHAPMPAEELVRKFIDCGAQAAKPASRDDLKRIAENWMLLENAPDVAPLMQRL